MRFSRTIYRLVESVKNWLKVCDIAMGLPSQVRKPLPPDLVQEILYLRDICLSKYLSRKRLLIKGNLLDLKLHLCNRFVLLSFLMLLLWAAQCILGHSSMTVVLPSLLCRGLSLGRWLICFDLILRKLLFDWLPLALLSPIRLHDILRWQGVCGGLQWIVIEWLRALKAAEPKRSRLLLVASLLS